MKMLPRLPDPILNAPQLRIGLDFYLWAYFDLMADRPASFGGFAPIPWSSCDRYARRYGFDDEQFELLVYFVRSMDQEYRDWCEKKNPKTSPSKPGPIRRVPIRKKGR